MELLYWSIEANMAAGKNWTNIGELGLTIRQFDLDFNLRNYGYSKTKGFKAVVKDAQTHNLVYITDSPDASGEFNIFPIKANFKKFLKKPSQPSNFEIVKYSRRAYNAKRLFEPFLQKFVTEVERVQESYNLRAQPLTALVLLKGVAQNLKEKNAPCQAAYQVLLKGGCVSDVSGKRLTEMDLENEEPIVIWREQVAIFGRIAKVFQECSLNLQETSFIEEIESLCGFPAEVNP